MDRRTDACKGKDEFNISPNFNAIICFSWINVQHFFCSFTDTCTARMHIKFGLFWGFLYQPQGLHYDYQMFVSYRNTRWKSHAWHIYAMWSIWRLAIFVGQTCACKCNGNTAVNICLEQVSFFVFGYARILLTDTVWNRISISGEDSIVKLELELYFRPYWL